MRWCIFHCLLFTMILGELDGRNKRDLNYLQNLFRSVYLGSSRHTTPRTRTLTLNPKYQIYRRVPGYEDIVIKHVSDTEPDNRRYNLVSRQETNRAIAEYKDLLKSREFNEVIKEEIREAVPVTRLGISPGIVVVKDPEHKIPIVKDATETKLKSDVPYQTQYSYKLLQNNEPVMTYYTKNNPKVTEDIKVRAVIPMCIQKRIDELMLLEKHPYRIERVKPKNSVQPAEKNQHSSVQEDIVVKAPRNVTKVKPIKPLQTFLNVGSWPTDIVGLIPPPYIPRETSYGSVRSDSEQTKDEVNQENIDQSTANTVLNIKPFISSYSYKQLNHNSPDPFTEVKVGDDFYTKFAHNLDSNMQIPNNFVYIPPYYRDKTLRDMRESSDINLTTSDNSLTTAGKGSTNNLRKNYLRLSMFSNQNPIIVSEDEKFPQHQSNVDKSSMSFDGKSGVGVMQVDNKNRGDIPEQ